MKRILFLLPFALSGCHTLQPPTYVQSTASISKYKYVVIPEYGAVTSAVASNGNAVSKEILPSNLIEGLLLKKGIFRISSPEPRFIEQLLIVKYGISGKRKFRGGGYAQEVTINLIDANSFTPAFTCTAEGVGETDADDIRDAIFNCLQRLK